MIHRSKRDRNYAVISNDALRDSRLSWKARGILAYLLSRPDNWQCQEADLIAQAPDGRDAVRSAMRELREFGYVVREADRTPDGRLCGWRFTVYEIARVEGDYQSGKPSDGKPVRRENRRTENPTHKKERSLRSTEFGERSTEQQQPRTPTQDEPTGSLSDTAPPSVVRSEGKPDDLGLYVENVLSEADRNPDRAHWRQAAADALAHSKTPVRSPKAFVKHLVDTWITDPDSRPLPPAPVGSTPPRRMTPNEERLWRIGQESKASYERDMARLHELMPDDDAEPLGNVNAPPLRLAAGGFAT